MRKNLKISNRGMSLLEVMISIGIMAIVSIQVLQLTSQIFSSKKYLDVNQTVLSYQFEQIAISKNSNIWVDKFRDKSAAFKACFPSVKVDASTGLPEVPDTRTYNCEAAVTLADDIKLQLGEAATAFHYVPMVMHNGLGNKIAGTDADPYFMNNDGTSCTANCPLQVTGYVGRENPALDQNPGQMVSVVVLRRNESFQGPTTVPLKTRVLATYVGTSWEKIVSVAAEDQSLSGICPTGQMVYGVDSDGRVLCRGGAGNCLPGNFVTGFSAAGSIECKAFKAIACPANEYLYGLDSDGNPRCNALPQPPPTPPPVVVPTQPVYVGTVSCDSWKYRAYTCALPTTATSVSLAVQRSSSGCSVGYSFGLIGNSTIQVTNGCRGSFNLYR